MNNLIWVGLYVFLLAYLLIRFFSKKNKPVNDYQKLYDKIINSEEYKVKGQYDR